MHPQQTSNSKTIYHGRILNLRIDTIIAEDGREAIREIVEHRDCITVVAVDNKDRILLVRQFREALGKQLLELPAGGVESGEDPLQAMQRELREETGYQANQIRKIGGFYLSPGYSTEFCHLFFATDLKRAPLTAEDSAGIKLVRVPVKKVAELIASGKISDAKTVAGLSLVLSPYHSGSNISLPNSIPDNQDAPGTSPYHDGQAEHGIR